jgi:hypothetical protein
MKCDGSEAFLFFGRWWNFRSMKLNDNVIFGEWKQDVLQKTNFGFTAEQEEEELWRAQSYV